MEYRPRIVDTELDALLEGLPAVSLEGPKAVGKTETALRRARTVHRLDDPGQLEIVRGAPERLTTGDPPILVDEWQRLPASWDLVRRAVDRDPRPAGFLLTGSAAPSDTPTHSGAGRIVTVRMRPMALAERAIATPTVRLAALLRGDRPALGGITHLTLTDYAEEITRSGFPALRSYTGRLLRAQLDGYVDRIVEREFVELGKPVRNPGALRGGSPPTPPHRRRRRPTRRSATPPPRANPTSRRRRPPAPTGPSWSNCGSSSRFPPGRPPGTGCAGSRPPPSTSSPIPPWRPDSSASTLEPWSTAPPPGLPSRGKAPSSAPCSSRWSRSRSEPTRRPTRPASDTSGPAAASTRSTSSSNAATAASSPSR